MKKSVNLFLIYALCAVSLPALCAQQGNTSQSIYLDNACVYKEVLDYDRAIAVLNRVPPAEVTDTIKRLKADLLYLKGESKSALGLYKSISNKDWTAYVYLGLIREDLGELEEAIKAYESSLSLSPNSIALLRLGKIYLQKNEPLRASQFFLRLIKFEPSMRITAVYLAQSLMQAGDIKDAYRYFAKGLIYYPENQTIKKQLNETKKKLGDTVLSQLQQAVEEVRKNIKFSFYVREENIPTIKVGLAVDLEELSLRCFGTFTVKGSGLATVCRKDSLYTFELKGDKLALMDQDKTILRTFEDDVEITTENHPFYVYDITYGKDRFWHKTIDRAYRGNLRLKREKNSFTLINEVSIEEYLYGVLPAEVPASAQAELLRAQAIAARSFAFNALNRRHKNSGFDVCADVHCQVYHGISVETEKTNQAVKDTRGQVLTYENKPLDAFYHSNCGGCLKSNLFGGKIKYLETHADMIVEGSSEYNANAGGYQQETWFKSYPQSFCANAQKSNFRWQRIYDADDFLTNFGFPISELVKIVPIEKDDCFHYDAIRISTKKWSKVLRGDSAIRAFFDKLRSSAFKLEIKYSQTGVPQMLIIWGGGFGHGGGMCQEGALTMAKQGYPYKEILQHYYPKASLDRLY